MSTGLNITNLEMQNEVSLTPTRSLPPRDMKAISETCNTSLIRRNLRHAQIWMHHHFQRARQGRRFSDETFESTLALLLAILVTSTCTCSQVQ